MAELIVGGDGEEHYVGAMAEVMPFPWYQPFKRQARDLAVQTAYGAAQNEWTGALICGDEDWTRQIAEDRLVERTYGAFPTLLIVLWPLLQPIVIAVIKRLIDYWRNRPQAVGAIQAAARRSA